MTISLIVKGSPVEAARAAADRNIPFVVIREATDNKTIGETSASYTDVAKWFAEAPDRAPFPVGTLMRFTGVEEERRMFWEYDFGQLE